MRTTNLFNTILQKLFNLKAIKGAHIYWFPRPLVNPQSEISSPFFRKRSMQLCNIPTVEASLRSSQVIPTPALFNTTALAPEGN
jgi:hypothetical protein